MFVMILIYTCLVWKYGGIVGLLWLLPPTPILIKKKKTLKNKRY